MVVMSIKRYKLLLFPLSKIFCFVAFVFTLNDSIVSVSVVGRAVDSYLGGLQCESQLAHVLFSFSVEL